MDDIVCADNEHVYYARRQSNKQTDRQRTLQINIMGHRACGISHQLRPSGVYCCSPDCLELAARLSP